MREGFHHRNTRTLPAPEPRRFRDEPTTRCGYCQQHVPLQDTGSHWVASRCTLRQELTR